MRRRILLVSPFAPIRDARHGSAHVIHGLASALADRHDVVVVHVDAIRAEPDLEARCEAVHMLDVARSSSWGRRVAGGIGLVRGRSRRSADLRLGRLRHEVGTLVRRYRPDVVQVEHVLLGDALMSAETGQLRVVTIYDPAASDFESLVVEGERRGVLLRAQAAASVRHERRVLRLAHAGVVFTDRDRALLAPHVPDRVELVTIPLGWTVPARAFDPAGARAPTLLFVGNFLHLPNIDAALRLVNRIVPLVRVNHPEVGVEIVGRCPPDEVVALAQEGVRVTGDVDSVVPYLERASVVVAPISIGGGTRVKVLEALAAGKAVVATTRGAEGIAASRDTIVVADGDHEMASAISRLLGDEGARRQMGEQARAWALRELTWSTMATRYEELYERVAARRARARGTDRERER